MIPVSIVTGFLGSGKTTLIARLLRDPLLARTAVVVNEWGEAGLDHALIASSDESMVTLTTGCLCCRMRSDIATTLMGLFAERKSYDRVLIETSGLADPVPVLQALISDSDVAATHIPDSVVTLVDAVHGTEALARHQEARRQITLADRIVVTKTDVAPLPARLAAHVAILNPHAPVLAGVCGQLPPGELFGGFDPAGRVRRLDSLARDAGGHGSAGEAIIIERTRPLPALALAMWLQALAEHAGERLLRVKGVAAVEEMPGRPAVIHAVRHSIAAPEWLDRWPPGLGGTRLVVIGEAIPRFFPLRLLEAIEGDVRGG